MFSHTHLLFFGIVFATVISVSPAWPFGAPFQSTISTSKQCIVIKRQGNQPTGHFYCPDFWRLPSVSWPYFEAVIAFFPNDPDPPRAWPYCQKSFKWTKDHKDVYFDEDLCLRPQKAFFSSGKNFMEALSQEDWFGALKEDQSYILDPNGKRQCCSAIQFKRWKLKPNEQIPFENPYYVPQRPGADSDFDGMLPTDRQIASDESQTPQTEPTNSQISSNESTDSQTSPTEPVDNQISSNEHTDSPVSSNKPIDNEISSNQPIDVQVSSNEATDNQISLNEPIDGQTSPREDPDTSTK